MIEPTQQPQILLGLPDIWNPDSWNIGLQQSLNSYGVTATIALTIEEAIDIVQSQKLQGIVVVSEWLITEDGRILELMKKIPDDMPMVFLIDYAKGWLADGYKWFELIYQSGFREYVEFSASDENIIYLLKKIGVIRASTGHT